MVGYSVEFGAKALNGKLVFNNEYRLANKIDALEGRDLIVTIQLYEPERSNALNAFFHGFIVPIVRERLLEFGWEEARSAKWVKQWIKTNWLLFDVKDTSELSQSDFRNFIADIQRKAAQDLDLFIKDPDPEKKERILITQ